MTKCISLLIQLSAINGAPLTLRVYQDVECNYCGPSISARVFVPVLKQLLSIEPGGLRSSDLHVKLKAFCVLGGTGRRPSVDCRQIHVN